MAHSIELLLDEDSDAAIRRVWHRLSDAGLPSQLRVKSDTNRPHITVLAADRILPDGDATLSELRVRFPLPVVVGAPVIFGGGKMTLARLIVASADLLDLHRDIYRRCLPSTRSHPSRTARPGTGPRTRRSGAAFTAEQVARALDVIEDLSADISADVVGLRRWDGDARIERCWSAERRERRRYPVRPALSDCPRSNPARSRA